MIIMKFGGTSVGTAASIQKVFRIVQRVADQQPVVVVSAHAGITNALVELSQRAPAGEPSIEDIAQKHRQILADLELPTDMLDELLEELGDLARGMKLVSEASPRAVDLLLSFGERCSSRVLAAYFNKQGMAAQAVDAFDAGLRTDNNYGRAHPQPDDGRIAKYFAGIKAVPVVTGFIAKDDQGNITTLGRNGSDFSAALFGNALGAKEIQIWTDVDGVMTADPSMVKNTKPIPTMSFGEASELAYYGGRVLHPATIKPAMVKNIPVRVLNTSKPESPGSLILPDFEEPGVAVRAVVYKEGIFLVNLVSQHMLQQHGFLARVFQAANENHVDLDLVATSEVSVSMTADRGDNLEALAESLRPLGEVSVEPDHALICVVGQGIANKPGVAASVFTTLAEAGVRVRVISQGAIKVNIGLVVAEADLEKAVRALHARFFES